MHTHTHTETNQGLLTVQLQTLMKRVYVCRRVSAIDDCLLHVSSSCSLSLACARAWMLTALTVGFSSHAQPGTADWLYGPSHAIVCVALSSGEPLPDRKSGTASSLHCRASHLISFD